MQVSNLQMHIKKAWQTLDHLMYFQLYLHDSNTNVVTITLAIPFQLLFEENDLYIVCFFAEWLHFGSW